MKQAAVNAPPLSTRLGWVNTDRSYSLQDFSGKMVLLDFWTYGCINCQHILPDLRRLEAEYADELVVIGVHSGKFSAEHQNEKIREAILKFGVHHPVINDADYKLWDAYAIRAWPTVVLISPNGKVVGQHAGEGAYQVVKPYLDELLEKYKSQIRKDRLPFQNEPLPASRGPLRFPSKLIAGEKNTLWCADSGHNRLLQFTTEGQLLTSIGSGEQGFANGSFQSCSFYEPHGMALQGHLLYIADTKNNAIRLADLRKKSLSTLAGSGKLDYYFFEDRREEAVLPNSPWDLLLKEDILYIASAGNHQILQMKLKEGIVKRFAGTGREALVNGNLREACFNQPSGLSLEDNTLYIADAEASAIRAIDLQEGLVYTPLGKGLFDFGDEDGDVEDALLQHNMGLAAQQGLIYIADTYNGKVKVLDLHKERVKTILSGLNEPNDLLLLNNELWISDTHNHQLLRLNLRNMQKKVVTLKFD